MDDRVQRAAHARWIVSVLPELVENGGDELAVIADDVAGWLLGRREYGALDLATDPRDLVHELAAEERDSRNYLTALRLQARRRRLAAIASRPDEDSGSKASPSAVGQRGVRDPEFPCVEYEPGPERPDARCETDGHYLCDGCVHRDTKPANVPLPAGIDGAQLVAELERARAVQDARPLADDADDADEPSWRSQLRSTSVEPQPRRAKRPTAESMAELGQVLEGDAEGTGENGGGGKAW